MEKNGRKTAYKNTKRKIIEEKKRNLKRKQVGLFGLDLPNICDFGKETFVVSSLFASVVSIHLPCPLEFFQDNNQNIIVITETDKR